MITVDLSAVMAETFRGGGAKGVVYCGALEVLTGAWARNVARAGERDAPVIAATGYAPRVHAGTSAGAIFAGLRAIGYDAPAIAALLTHTDFLSFNRDMHANAPWFAELIGDVARLRMKGGLNSGDALGAWLDSLFGRVRFGDLDEQLEVWAWDIRARRPVHFSRALTPHVVVSIAIRASTAIPGYYVPANVRGRLMWDGGLVYNDPLVTLLGRGLRPENVLGFRVASSSTASADEKTGPLSLREMLGALGHGLTENTEAGAWALMPEEWRARSIGIDACGVGATDWAAISDAATVAKLLESGRAAARRWLNTLAQPGKE